MSLAWRQLECGKSHWGEPIMMLVLRQEFTWADRDERIIERLNKTGDERDEREQREVDPGPCPA